MKTYIQCTLAQGNTRTVGWIEERGAKLGACVEIKDDGFWDVIGVGSIGLSKDQVDAMGRAKFGSIT